MRTPHQPAALRSLRAVLSMLVVAVVPGVAPAQQATAESPIDGARSAMERFIDAWNQADNAAVRATLHFPHLTMARGNLVIAATPGEFETDFDALRDAGWHHSSILLMEATHASPRQVHFELDFARHREDGSIYRRGHGTYIVTLQDGRWGMQARLFAEPLGAAATAP